MIFYLLMAVHAEICDHFRQSCKVNLENIFTQFLKFTFFRFNFSIFNKFAKLVLITFLFYNFDVREKPLKYIMHWNKQAGKLQNEMTNLSWNYVVNMTENNLANKISKMEEFSKWKSESTKCAKRLFSRKRSSRSQRCL